MNLPPSSRVRGSQVLVTWPKLPLSPLGPPALRLLNWVWLKVLNDSKRSSKCARSVIANDLYSDVVKLTRLGPTTASLPALPKPWFWPPAHAAVGLENNVVSNHSFFALLTCLT